MTAPPIANIAGETRGSGLAFEAWGGSKEGQSLEDFIGQFDLEKVIG
jgi:hypothetical protein